MQRRRSYGFNWNIAREKGVIMAVLEIIGDILENKVILLSLDILVFMFLLYLTYKK